MTQYVERRAVVQAVRFTGENIRECADLAHPGWQSGDLPPGWWTMNRPGETRLVIEEKFSGSVYLEAGHWLVRSGRGALQALPDDEFCAQFVAARDLGAQP